MSCCGLAGDTNINYLKENGVKIWDDWADEKETWVQSMVISGDLGQPQMATKLIRLLI